VVTAAAVTVPGCRLKAISIVLCDVHLRATRCAAAAGVAVRVAIAGEGQIEIIVYIAMRACQVHIKLDETTCQVVGCLGADTSPTLNMPTIIIQLWTAIVNVEVRAAWAICGVLTGAR